MKHAYVRLMSILLLFLLLQPAAGFAQPLQTRWYDTDDNGAVRLHVYFFWSKKCPHCLQAAPFLQQLDKDADWLVLHSLELTEHPQHVKLYQHMAADLGQQARSVPAFFYCGQMQVGYADALTTGEQLRNNLQACYQQLRQLPGKNSMLPDFSESSSNLELPLIGNLDTSQQSLLLLTVVIAGMDAFNPCAFFVLLFLLSMLVHARSRSRMLIIGSVFVFFSGLVYFIFMSAWLNLFLYLGELRIMTLVAGILAIVMAAVNIKDYFWFHRGVSLSITDSAKPRLFERMRHLLALEYWPAMLLATVLLALAANSYELLCTAGFPMVYTRILTLRDLVGGEYYFFLLLYNLIYVLPLLIIVLLFTLRLGSRKLSEKEGRSLKLLSGSMMLMLGALLLFAPQWLNNVLVAMLLLFCAAVLTLLANRFFAASDRQRG